MAKGRSWRLLALVWAVGWVVCGHGIPVTTTSPTGATAGRVRLADKPHGIRVAKIVIERLPELRSGASKNREYVVWARRSGIADENVGVLRFGKRGATLETVVPADDFLLLVTAEPTESVRSPSTRPLFVANVSSP